MTNLNKFLPKGLPGGPNENQFSIEGYKSNSPDRFNPFNVINSGNITMQDVNHPVFGVDNYGNKQMMYPGYNYQFPGSQVFELPIKQDGGSAQLSPNPAKDELGYRAPLDGSTMPKDLQAGVALFPGRYGNTNFFADNYNKVREGLEASYLEDPYWYDADGNRREKNIDPDVINAKLPGEFMTMHDSAQKARRMNRYNRQHDLGYQKIQRDAFYNPTGSKQGYTARFQDGGQNDYVDMDLTEEEIESLRRLGYDVDDL